MFYKLLDIMKGLKMVLVRLTYATPKTLRDAGYFVDDRQDKGLGKKSNGCRKDGQPISQPPRTRQGKSHPGGRSLRRVLSRLEVRSRDFELSEKTARYLGEYTRPGSRKP